MPVSSVHNPKKNPKEGVRVESVGGHIWNDRLAHPNLNPNYFSIAVSRSIGDIMFKDEQYLQGKVSGLTAEPEIQQLELTPEDEFLILACDGVWDVFSHQEAVDFARPRLQKSNDPNTVAEQLTKEAFDKGSQDNITTMIVTLKEW